MPVNRPQPGQMTRQDQRKRKTRQQLMGAAERLFAAHGPDAVSIDDIVAAADVAKGTFYKHFLSKEEIARDLARVARAALEDDIAAANHGLDDPAQRVARALCVAVRMGQTTPARAGALLRLFHGVTDPDAPMNAGLSRDISEGMKSGRFALPGRAPAILFVLGAALALIARSIAARKGMAAIARDVVALVLQGLGIARAEAVKIATAAAAQIIAPNASQRASRKEPSR